MDSSEQSNNEGERAARESEELYRVVTETASDAIITIDETSSILFVNPATERMFGYASDEMIGQSLTMLMPEEFRPRHRGGVGRYLATSRRHIPWESVPAKGLHKSGAEFPLEISFGEFVRDGKHFFTGILRDITARRQTEAALREREAEFGTLADSIPQLAWMADAEGFIFWYNRRWYEYTGTTLEEMQGWGWQKVHHPAEVERVVENIKRSFSTGEAWEDTFPLRSKEGEYRWFLSRALPIRNGEGNIVRWFGTNTDVEEQRRTEQALDRKSRQAALGADVGVALAKSGALQSILQRCAEAMVQYLDAAFARIWTLNERENVLELQASAGIYTHLDGEHSRVPVGKFKIGLIAEEREPHLTNSVVGDARVGDQEWAKREEMVAFAGYPLIVEDRLVGVMAMFARAPLTNDALDTLGAVANTIAQGIERKRAEEALAKILREREMLLEEVSTPVVPVWPGILAMPLIGSLDTGRMERATAIALDEVRRTGAHTFIVDITGARIIDSHAVANLSNLVGALKLIGAEGIITGVTAQVARTLVGLGIDLHEIRTHRTLAEALQRVVRSNGNK